MAIPERDPADPIHPGEVRVSTHRNPDGGVVFTLEGDARVIASIRKAVEDGELTHLAGHPITLVPDPPVVDLPSDTGERKCRSCGYARWGCGCISFDAPRPDFGPRT